MIEFNQNKRICLIGDGWGAISAFKSLKKLQNPLFVMTNDEDIKIEQSNKITNLKNLKDEILIFAGYKPIVPSEIIDNNLCINIHYSLLPAYRGLHSTVWAILNDEPKLGLTVHEMDKYIDNGAIIYQYEVKNDFVSSSREYMALFNAHIEDNLYKIIMNYLNGEIKPKPQDKSQASWVGRRKQQDCRIDFDKTLNYQKAFFRALVTPYPLPYFEYHNKKYVVTKTGFHSSGVVCDNARILNIDNEGMWVKVDKGYLIIKEIVDEENKPVSFNSFKIGVYLNK